MRLCILLQDGIYWAGDTLHDLYTYTHTDTGILASLGMLSYATRGGTRGSCRYSTARFKGRVAGSQGEVEPSITDTTRWPAGWSQTGARGCC